MVEKVINEVTRAADIEASKEIFSDIYSKGSTALEKVRVFNISQHTLRQCGRTGSTLQHDNAILPSCTRSPTQI